LDPDKFASTEQWFARFRIAFQGELDAAAEARIKYWGSRIWVVTAVAPNAVVDSGATLFYTFSMLSDLCQIYNLRAGRTGTAVLLSRVFFNAYLAGQGTEWEKLAEEQYDQLFGEAMNVVGVGVSSNVVGKLLGGVDQFPLDLDSPRIESEHGGQTCYHPEAAAPFAKESAGHRQGLCYGPQDAITRLEVAGDEAWDAAMLLKPFDAPLGLTEE
jgi:hypothetical protein